MIENKNILVTGASGFVAYNLIKSLVDKNMIWGVDRNPAIINEKNFFHIQKDFRDTNFFESLDSLNINIVIHLGAVNIKSKDTNSTEMEDTNSFFTSKLLSWSKGNHVEIFFYASSGGVYGFSEELLSESSKLDIDNDYSRSKYLAESYVQEYSKYFKTYIARPFFPYGPNMKPDLLFHRLISKIYFGKSVTLNLDGRPKISPIFITDFIDAITSIIANPKKKFSIYNICGDEHLSIKDICDKISNFLRKKYKFDVGGKSLDMCASNKKLKNEFDWCPKINVDTGLTETMQWFNKTLVDSNVEESF